MSGAAGAGRDVRKLYVLTDSVDETMNDQRVVAAKTYLKAELKTNHQLVKPMR